MKALLHTKKTLKVFFLVLLGMFVLPWIGAIPVNGEPVLGQGFVQAGWLFPMFSIVLFFPTLLIYLVVDGKINKLKKEQHTERGIQ
jgi:hypothetical protein